MLACAFCYWNAGVKKKPPVGRTGGRQNVKKYLEGDFVSSHKKGSRILRKEQFIFLYSVGLLFTLYCSHSTDVPCSSFSEITFTSLFLRLALYACFLRILPILHIML